MDRTTWKLYHDLLKWLRQLIYHVNKKPIVSTVDSETTCVYPDCLWKLDTTKLRKCIALKCYLNCIILCRHKITSYWLSHNTLMRKTKGFVDLFTVYLRPHREWQRWSRFDNIMTKLDCSKVLLRTWLGQSWTTRAIRPKNTSMSN